MGEKSGKVWGSTQPLFDKNNVEMSRIEVVKGGFCSIHHHNHKFNAFYVESGSLLIRVWKSYNLVDETTLGPGDITHVSPQENHQFFALEDTVAFEIYYNILSLDDIERSTHGGIVSSIEELKQLDPETTE